MLVAFTAQNTPITLGSVFASGGQGEIRSIPGIPTSCAKIIARDKRSATLEAKLGVMLSNPPSIESGIEGIPLAAWPSSILYDQNGCCCGYLMPRVANTVPLMTYTMRQQIELAGFVYSTEFNYGVARNLAVLIHCMHEYDYIVGDLNSENVLVNTVSGGVTLVDCDSISVIDRKRNIGYFCKVGRDVIASPERLRRPPSGYRYTAFDDFYALAYLIFQLVTLNDPFDGKLQGRVVGPCELQKSGEFPFSSKTQAEVRNPRMSYRGPDDLFDLFEQCFISGFGCPSARPGPMAFVQVLDKYL